MKKSNNDILELYKLHAELADRVSQRREGANRLFGSVFIGLILFLGTFIQLGTNDAVPAIILLFVGVVGCLLGVSWYIVICSYSQLQKGKFHVLHKMEEQLAFSFFKTEWEYLKGNEKQSYYWRLTVVERLVPIILIVISFILLIIGLFSL